MLGGEETKMANGNEEWLLLDGKGEMELVEAGRDAVMRRTGLYAHDLCKLLFDHFLFCGHERAIVINFEHVKAIITVQEVLLLNSGDPSVMPFVHELQAWILRHHQGSSYHDSNPDAIKILPFEFVVLEGCLEAACNVLENEAKMLEQEAHSALNKLTSKISILALNLKLVRQIKTQLVGITKRVEQVRNKLEHLRKDHEYMAKMYLREKLAKHERDSHGTRGSTNSAITKQLNVKELKMLLEDYFVQMDDTLKKLSTLREYVNDTEDYIEFMLDYKQNHRHQMRFMFATVITFLSVAVTAWFKHKR